MASNNTIEPPIKRHKGLFNHCRTSSDEGSLNGLFRVVVGESTYSVDKSLITKHSHYFRQLIEGPTCMQESQTNRMELKGIDASTFESVLQYMNGKDIEINQSNVDSMLNASSLFLIDGLISLCCDFLLENLSPATLIDTLELCKTYTLEQVSESVRLNILDHFISYASAPCFLDMDLKLLTDLVSSDRLRISSELELYKYIQEWISKSHQAATERQELNEGMLFSHVRYCLISSKDLQLLSSSSSFKKLPESIRTLINEALTYRQSLENLEQSLLRVPVKTGLQNQMRLENREASLILVFEGIHLNEHEIVAVKDWRNKDYELVSLHVSPADHRTCGVITLDNCVYVMSVENIGGFAFNCRIKLTRFDARTNLRHLMPYPPVQVETSGMAVIGRKIYFCGGKSRSFTVYVNTVQSFNVDTLQWSSTEPRLVYPLYQHGTVGYNGNIYISGGLQEVPGLTTNSVWCLKAGTDTDWRELAPMKFRRRCHTMLATSKGKLIVCGGMSSELPREYQRRIPMEIYDISTNQWTEIRQNSALMGDSYGHYIILPEFPSSLLSLGHELYRAQEHEIWKTDIDSESDKYLMDELAISLPPRMTLGRTFASFLYLQEHPSKNNRLLHIHTSRKAGTVSRQNT